MYELVELLRANRYPFGCDMLNETVTVYEDSCGRSSSVIEPIGNGEYLIHSDIREMYGEKINYDELKELIENGYAII